MIVLKEYYRNLSKNISCNKLTYVSNCFLKIYCNPSFFDLAYLSILSLVAVVAAFDALLLTSNCLKYSIEFYYFISHDILPGHCDLTSRTCTNKNIRTYKEPTFQ